MAALPSVFVVSNFSKDIQVAHVAVRPSGV